MEARNMKYLIQITLVLGIITSFECLDSESEELWTMPLLMPNVQPKQKETYLCTAFKMPRTDFAYIVGFSPNATMETAHHILIYGCDIPGQYERDTPRLVWDCGEMSGQKSGYDRAPTCSTGSQVIYAWAKNAPDLKLPEGVGFKVGKDTGINYLVLQVHYATVDKFKNGATDDSGIFLHMLPSSTDKVSKAAGVFLLGTGGSILPKQKENFEASCEIEEDVLLHPFAFRTHTHALGKVVAGFKIDQQGEWTLIGKHNPQHAQMFYPVEDQTITIGKGDIVAARCTMYNFRNRETFIGSTAEDEMCNFYMMYYIDGDKPMSEKYCFSTGPPNYYWMNDAKIPYVPQSVEEVASSLDD